jgi:hypothetical protein
MITRHECGGLVLKVDQLRKNAGWFVVLVSCTRPRLFCPPPPTTVIYCTYSEGGRSIGKKSYMCAPNISIFMALSSSAQKAPNSKPAQYRD